MSLTHHERNSRTSIEQAGKVISQEEKINYLRIALGLQRIGVDNEMADRIIETYESILRLGGKFSISDAVEIEISLDRKYHKKDLEVHATNE